MNTEIATGMPPRTMRWTPARLFMLVSALWHLLLGAVGLIIDQTFPIGSDAAGRASSEHIFAIFETNGWHSLAALALGLASLYFTLVPRRARDAAMVIGASHVGLVIGLAIWPPNTFWLASNLADQVVHASTAVAGIAAALLTPSGGHSSN